MTKLTWFRKLVLVTLCVALTTTLPLPMLDLLFRSQVAYAAHKSRQPQHNAFPIAGEGGNPLSEAMNTIPTITDSAFESVLITNTASISESWMNQDNNPVRQANTGGANSLYLPIVLLPGDESDENGPMIEILAPHDRQSVYTQQPTIEISYSDFDSSVNTGSLVVQLVPENGTSTDITSDLTVTERGAQGTVSTALADDTTYTLSVSVADDLGNNSTASISFYIPPDPENITPPDASEDAGWVSGVIYDSATCNEHLTECQGVAGVQVSLSLIDTQALERVRAARAREIEREWLTRGKTPAPMDASVAETFSRPLFGTVITGPDGFFAFPVAQTGTYWLRAEKNGYTYGQRNAQVVRERSTATSDIYLTPLDSAVTTCDDKGCMHNSSDGSMQLEIPAGAIPAGETREVSATNFEQVEYLPSGDLPPGTEETYAFNLGGDSEITFDKAITVRQKNERGFAPGTRIPLGYWNQITQQWEHAGTGIVDASGEWIEMGVTHFSNYDCNDPVTEGDPKPDSKPEEDEEPPCEDCQKNCEEGCTIDLSTGRVGEDITLPSVQVLGEEVSPQLLYNTRRAFPTKVIDVKLSLDPEEGVVFSDTIGFELYIEGQKTDSFVFSADISTGEVGRFRYLWDGRDAQGNLLAPGSYEYAVKFGINYRAQYCYALNGIFGNPPDCLNGATGRFTTATNEVWHRGTVKLDTQIDTPFGDGWVLAEQQQLYATADGDILIRDGDRLDEFLDLGRVSFSAPRYPQRKAPVLAPIIQAESQSGFDQVVEPTPEIPSTVEPEDARPSPTPTVPTATVESRPEPHSSNNSSERIEISVDETPTPEPEMVSDEPNEPEPEMVSDESDEPNEPDTRQPYSAIRQGGRTEVCGAISANETWTEANSPYVITCDVTVESGVTLTVEPGVVVKSYGRFNQHKYDLHVYGTLITNGTTDKPIVFTSLRDDTYGGDTNNDGNATSPAPNHWDGITYHPGSSGHIINQVVLAYSDYGMYFNKPAQNTDLTIQNSSFISNSRRTVMLNLDGPSGRIKAANNTAEGNGINGVHIQGAISDTLVLDWQEQANLPLVLNNDVIINKDGGSLTLTPGTIIKSYGRFNQHKYDLHVYGTLITNGTTDKPIVFTSLRDDTYGGDTNNDGNTTSPAPNNWNGITYHPGSSGHNINQVVLAYSNIGIYFNNLSQNMDLTIQNSTFISNTRRAVMLNLDGPSGRIKAVNNTAEGNGINGVHIQGAISDTLVLDWQEEANLPLVLSNDVTINKDGGSLTLTPGTIIKSYGRWDWLKYDLHVYGTLIANGTTDKPIVFTSLRDDTYGGDTNNNGNSTLPAPNDWDGITYHPGSSGHIINQVVFAYSDYGMYFNNLDQNTELTIQNSTFISNTRQAAMLNLDGPSGQIKAVNNTAEGNGINGVHIQGAISDTLVLDWQEEANLPLVLSNDVTINKDGGSLTLMPGTIVKSYGRWDWLKYDLHVYGTLIANGTTDKPIVFTSLRDDTYGGDTNNNGNSTLPAPNDWDGITYHPGSSGHIINQVVFAYSDYGMYFNNLDQNTELTIQNSTFISNTIRAVMLNLDGPSGQIKAVNNTAEGNGINGVHIQGAISDTLVLDWQEEANLSLVLSNDVTINKDGGSLTLMPGTIVKSYGRWDWLKYDLHVYGTLIANGTTDKPIVFTSLRDDTYGGDTNNNGSANVPSRNHWDGIYFHTGSTSNVVKNTIVAYSDYGLYVEGGDISINGSQFYQNNAQGVYIGDNAFVSRILGNSFVGNGYGLQNASGTTIDAPYNWWGAASGPYHPRTNLEGEGNRVSDNVNYEPWLTSEQNVDGISLTETDYSGLTYDPDTNTYTRIYLDGTQVHFNPDGTHDYTLDPTGNKTLYTYNPDGTVATMGVMPAGASSAAWVWRFSYTGGKLSKITDPAGRETTVTINQHNDLTQVTFPDRSERQFVYDAQGLLTSQTDQNGDLTSYTYDEHGRLRQHTAPQRLVYDPNSGQTVLDQTIRHFTPSDTAYQLINDSPLGDPDNPAPAVPTSDELLDGVQYGRGTRTGQTNKWGAWLTETDGVGRTTTYERDDANNLTRQTYPDGDCVEYSYDENGNRLTEDRMGTDQCILARAARDPSQIQNWTYTYEERFNQIKSETDPNGNTTTYFYDYEEGTGEAGHLTRVEYPAVEDESGQVITPTVSYTYNAWGLMDTKTDQRGTVTKYVYTEGTPDEASNGSNPLFAEGVTPVPGLLTQVIEDFGDDSHLNLTTTYKNFDAQGNAQTMLDPRGNPTSYTFDAMGRRLTEEDALSRVTKYTYDERGNLIEMIQDYTSDGKTGRNVVTSYTYDASDRMLSERTAADGLVLQTSYTYDINGQLATQTDGNGNTTIYRYDEDDQMIAEIDPLGHTTQYGYTLKGQLETVTDPAGSVMRYEYDAFDRQKSQIVADGDLNLTTSYSYDLNDNLISITAPDGTVTCTTYDALNRRISETRDCGGLHLTTVYTYNAADDVIAMQNERGIVTQSSYDALGRMISTRQDANGLNLTTTYDYDSASNLISVTDERGVVTSFSYDALNRRASMTQDANGLSLTTTYNYDRLNNQSTVTDPNRIVTFTEYNAFGQPIRQVEDLATLRRPSALEAETTYSYDNNLNLIAITDNNGNTTQYRYNARNEDTQTLYADGTTVNLTYNPDSTLAERTDQANDTVTFAYDGAKRLLSKSYPDGSTQTFTYDAASRQTSASQTMSGHTTHNTFAYNNLSNVTSSTQTVDGLSWNVQYAYDYTAGESTITYPSGTTVVQRLDSLNRLGQVEQDSATVATYTYNDTAGTVSLAYANGVTTFVETDNLYRVNRINSALSGNDPFADYRYGYDDAGNRTYMQRAHKQNQPADVYQYDGLYQLTQVSYGADSTDPATITSQDALQSYQLDTLGNRLTVQNDGTTQTYSPNNGQSLTNPMNRYEQVDSAPFGYDAKGNLLTDDGNSYSYDYDNRQISMTGSGGTAEYIYDALGRRVAKVVNDVTTYYLYNNRYQVLEERNGSNTMTARYIYGAYIDEPLTMERSGVTYTYHRDAQFSVTEMTDSNGAVVERYEYDVYGEARIFDGAANPITTSAINNPYLYTARRYDAESRNYYFRARMYAHDGGRFLQLDPLGYVDGMNLYAAYFIPNRLDPMGLFNIIAGLYIYKSATKFIDNGIGNTLSCTYYDHLAKANPKCSYFKEAAKICRGDNVFVNELIKVALIYHAIESGNINKTSNTLNKIRKKLIEEDKKARAAGKIDCNGCTCGDAIDAYHNEAFEEAGISSSFYGGNLWPQGVPPNPVPSEKCCDKYENKECCCEKN